MKNRKIISIILIIAMIATTILAAMLSLTGCDSKEEPSPEKGELPASQPALTEEVPQESAEDDSQASSKKTKNGNIQVLEEYEYTEGEIEKINEAETVKFVSREDAASSNIPYFIKNVEVKRKNDNSEYAKASPDVDKVAELYVPLYKDTIKNICYNISANTSGDVMSILAVTMPYSTNGDDILPYLFNAIAIQKSGVNTISYIEFSNGIMTAYDTKNAKFTIDVNSREVKKGSKIMEATPEQVDEIATLLYKKYDVMYDKSAATIEESEQLEKEKAAVEEMNKVATMEEARKEQEEIYAAENRNQPAPAQQQTAGRSFTDKNGNTATYTLDEWAYLCRIWEYTGDAEHYVADHTNQELRQLLSQR